MRSIKRVAALVLSIVMICSFTMPAFAQDTVPEPPPASNTEQGESVAPPADPPAPEEGDNAATPPATGEDDNTATPPATGEADNTAPPATPPAPEEQAPALPNVVGFSVQRAPVTHFFAQFASGGVDAEEITQPHPVDASVATGKALWFAIYPSDKLKNPIPLDSAKITLSDDSVLKVKRVNEYEGNYDAIEIVPLKNGSCTITYTDDTITGSPFTLVLTLTNVPVPAASRTTFVRLNKDGTFLNTNNKIVDSFEHGTWHDLPYALAELKNGVPQGENSFKEFITPNDLEIKITRDDLGNAEVTATDTIMLSKVDGKNVIRMNPRGTPGKYRILFRYTSPIAAENTAGDSKDGKCERYFVYELLPKAQETEVIVAQGESIQAAIDKIGTSNEVPESTDNAITYIMLTGDTYDEDITVNKKVFITGTGSDPSKYPTLTGSIVFDADEHRGPNRTANAQVRNLTLKSKNPRQGTGVKVNNGKFGVAAIDVEGFAVGAEKSGPNAGINCNFTDCTIGYKVDMSGFDHNVSETTARTFTNNDTAIQLTGTSDGHSGMYIYNCNFINNRIDVDDQGNQAGYILYVAYNHHADNTASFDYDTDLAGHFTNVAKVSPYYREKIRFDGSEAFPPAKSYALPLDLADLPINQSMADKPIDTTNFPTVVKISLVQMGETISAPLASWDFAAADSTLAPTFNPAIATSLKDSSSNAAATLPSGATYQPVSFAHSGALPGAATVNVVKDATAPVSNLKLYKVVGNSLVLQPEAVTYSGGKYEFVRDSASDYIITDTTVSNNNNSSSDSSSGGSNDYVSSDEINNKLENTTGNNVNISVAGKPYVAASTFDTLKNNPDKTLVLKGDGFSWSFKGSDVKGNIPGLIAFNTQISSTSPNAEEIKKVTGGAETVNVYFSYHGQLPGKATVELAVDKKYNGKTLNFYYYNAAKKQLETVATGLAVKDGKVSVSITHCSDYILSPVALKATAAAANVNLTNPETGAVDHVPMAIAVAVLSCLGALAMLRTQKPE